MRTDLGTSDEDDAFCDSDLGDQALSESQEIDGIPLQELGRNNKRPTYLEYYVPYLKLISQSCTSLAGDIVVCSVELFRSLQQTQANDDVYLQQQITRRSWKVTNHIPNGFAFIFISYQYFS